jgi:hypothetical protein
MSIYLFANSLFFSDLLNWSRIGGWFLWQGRSRRIQGQKFRIDGRKFFIFRQRQARLDQTSTNLDQSFSSFNFFVQEAMEIGFLFKSQIVKV